MVGDPKPGVSSGAEVDTSAVAGAAPVIDVGCPAEREADGRVRRVGTSLERTVPPAPSVTDARGVTGLAPSVGFVAGAAPGTNDASTADALDVAGADAATDAEAEAAGAGAGETAAPGTADAAWAGIATAGAAAATEAPAGGGSVRAGRNASGST